MLGRKDYTRDEYESARSAVAIQLAAYLDLVSDRADETSGTAAGKGRR